MYIKGQSCVHLAVQAGSYILQQIPKIIIDQTALFEPQPSLEDCARFVLN
jgi:hypothetical protein